MANGKDLSVFSPDPDLAEVLSITDETELDIISMQMAFCVIIITA